MKAADVIGVGLISGQQPPTAYDNVIYAAHVMPTSRWWLYWAAPSGLRLQILTQALRENLVSDHVGELKV